MSLNSFDDLIPEDIWVADGLENCLNSPSEDDHIEPISPKCGAIVEQYWYCYEEDNYDPPSHINDVSSPGASAMLPSLNDTQIDRLDSFLNQYQGTLKATWIDDCERLHGAPHGNDLDYNQDYWRCIRNNYDPWSREFDFFDERHVGAYYDKTLRRWRGYHGECDPRHSSKKPPNDREIAVMRCRVARRSCDELRRANDAYSVAQATSGSLSIVASVTVIIIMFRSRTRFASTFNRIMLGLCASDILSSLCFVVGFTALPKESYHVERAFGDDVTCRLQAYFMSSGLFTSPYYTCALCLYYLAIVRYKKTDAYIRTKLERWFLALPPVVAVVPMTGLIAVNTDFADDTGTVCVYQRSATVIVMQGMVLSSPFLVLVAMTLMWLEVRRVEGKVSVFRRKSSAYNMKTSLQTSIRGSARRGSIVRFGVGSGNSDNFKRSRSIFVRACMYSTAFIFVWICEIVRAGYFLLAPETEEPFGLVLASKIFFPLQGFFNFFIYLYPRVVAARDSRDKPSWSRSIQIAMGSKKGRRPSLVRNSIMNNLKEIIGDEESRDADDELPSLPTISYEIGNVEKEANVKGQMNVASPSLCDQNAGNMYSDYVINDLNDFMGDEEGNDVAELPTIQIISGEIGSAEEDASVEGQLENFSLNHSYKNGGNISPDYEMNNFSDIIRNEDCGDADAELLSLPSISNEIGNVEKEIETEDASAEDQLNFVSPSHGVKHGGNKYSDYEEEYKENIVGSVVAG